MNISLILCLIGGLLHPLLSLAKRYLVDPYEPWNISYLRIFGSLVGFLFLNEICAELAICIVGSFTIQESVFFLYSNLLVCLITHIRFIFVFLIILLVLFIYLVSEGLDINYLIYSRILQTFLFIFVWSLTLHICPIQFGILPLPILGLSKILFLHFWLNIFNLNRDRISLYHTLGVYLFFCFILGLGLVLNSAGAITFIPTLLDLNIAVMSLADTEYVSPYKQSWDAAEEHLKNQAKANDHYSYHRAGGERVIRTLPYYSGIQEAIDDTIGKKLGGANPELYTKFLIYSGAVRVL